jgi:hypothetical protein
MRGGAPAAPIPYHRVHEPENQIEIDVTREYPPEGADAKGAIPDDLVEETPEDERPSEPKKEPVS